MRIPPRVSAIELPQFDLLNDIAARWRAQGADVINLGQALPGFPPPDVAVEAFQSALQNPSSHVYSADAGIPELRSALAASLAAECGAAIDPETEIIITAGGNQAFQLALTTLVDAGEEVILPSPYFLNHEMAVRSVGAVPVEAPGSAAQAFVPAWDELASLVTPRTRGVVLVSPSNPTGAVIPQRTVQQIVSECAAREIVVFVDETYLRFVYDGPLTSAAALPSWQANVIVVGSFSKSYAITGWRCGYLLADRTVIDQALKIQDCMVICAPVPVQRAMAAVLQAEPNYTARWLPELKARRDALVSTLTRMDGFHPVAPGGGFFVMVRVDGCTDSRAFATDLVEAQQIVTIPGRFFGQAGEGYLRLSYGAAPVERLREACGRLEKHVRA
jgi:aspartate/methionine/tyrosine aminotransferase